MNRKIIKWSSPLVAALLFFTLNGMAQISAPAHLSGLINDYTPSTSKPPGPWEVRGEWSLQLEGDSGKAQFSATLTMVRSDLAVILNNAQVDNPSTRTPHTHHITVVDGTVTPLVNGIQVDGLATITASGSPAPFNPSHVQIKITGGSSVALSNISVTFLDGATGHFGDQPLEGVVRARPNPPSDPD